ncbi:MAG TPA: bifunctional hydroxymethylpyrimidine kinase/phosphomethylpyrimidine kinase [Terriglobales bacterium]|nr:bifunctional hydroxymethylpyrimidine kinase/phosphomethylpyrimidine kinase [Terriglobales bacterium]
MAVTPPVVLTIAGFDPSSGAGITADIKTIAAHDCYGISCITALTVQSTQGVRRVEAVDPKIVGATLEELVSDISVDAVHIGMLANESIVAVVADFLARKPLPHVVLDPILRSSSGADLLDPAGTKLLLGRLIPLVEVVTPNLDEAGILVGTSAPTNLDQMREAARKLHSLGAANVVITGGHLEKAIDLLSFTTARGRETEIFKAERLPSNSTHGTGCAFSTALACHLALGRGLPEAVLLAKVYVSAAIANGHPLGQGVGPLNHLYRSGQQRRTSTVVADKEPVH